jgi:hypothetical protein
MCQEIPVKYHKIRSAGFEAVTDESELIRTLNCFTKISVCKYSTNSPVSSLVYQHLSQLLPSCHLAILPFCHLAILPSWLASPWISSQQDELCQYRDLNKTKGEILMEAPKESLGIEPFRRSLGNVFMNEERNAKRRYEEMGAYFAVSLECLLTSIQFISRRRQWIGTNNWEQQMLL